MTTLDPTLPDFRSPAFLRAHIAETMAFYHPRCIDPAGGFFHYFKDDGTVYDRRHRHLVSSTRFVFNYAMAAREFADDGALQAEYLHAARHGLVYLREVHRNPATGGYAWTVRDGVAEDRTNHAYGVAFVLLAYATARKAGIEETKDWMDETWALLESRFWDARCAGLAACRCSLCKVWYERSLCGLPVVQGVVRRPVVRKARYEQCDPRCA